LEETINFAQKSEAQVINVEKELERVNKLYKTSLQQLDRSSQQCDNLSNQLQHFVKAHKQLQAQIADQQQQLDVLDHVTKERDQKDESIAALELQLQQLQQECLSLKEEKQHQQLQIQQLKQPQEKLLAKVEEYQQKVICFGNRINAD